MGHAVGVRTDYTATQTTKPTAAAAQTQRVRTIAFRNRRDWHQPQRNHQLLCPEKADGPAIMRGGNREPDGGAELVSGVAGTWCTWVSLKQH
jgi:hypothetical protein